MSRNRMIALAAVLAVGVGVFAPPVGAQAGHDATRVIAVSSEASEQLRRSSSSVVHCWPKRPLSRLTGSSKRSLGA